MGGAVPDPAASPWPGAGNNEVFSHGVHAVAPPAAPTGMTVEFTGRRGALFWLALQTGFFTVLSFGFYRFWMKTRLRRWYWSAIRPGGYPMEYTGDPWEKLLGFFIAVVILTFYIGIVNLLLMFVSFSIFSSSWVGYAASFAGMVPLWFYASYRARRYVLARTRWRGVRFGLEPGAWGYAGRAILHWLITLLSLGILWPRMTFALEKYRTDRTFFGSARLRQGGRWSMLYRAAGPFLFSAIGGVAVAVWVLLLDPVVPVGLASDGSVLDDLSQMLQGRIPATGWSFPERLLLLPLALAGMLYGAIHYRWTCKRLLADHKSADGIAFVSTLSAARVGMIYVIGNFLSYLVLVLGVIAIAFVGLATFGEGILALWGYSGDMFADLPGWVAPAILAVLYIGVFLLWGVLHNTFVTFPLMRHMARTLSLSRADGIKDVSQRARDEFAEAEGFAEALDLGAAI